MLRWETKSPNTDKLHMCTWAHTLRCVTRQDHLSGRHTLTMRVMSNSWTHTSMRTGCLDATLIWCTLVSSNGQQPLVDMQELRTETFHYCVPVCMYMCVLNFFFLIFLKCIFLVLLVFLTQFYKNVFTKTNYEIWRAAWRHNYSATSMVHFLPSGPLMHAPLFLPCLSVTVSCCCCDGPICSDNYIKTEKAINLSANKMIMDYTDVSTYWWVRGFANAY